jgi:argininosuccinate synthase
MTRIVLGYSGGLETSMAIPRLSERVSNGTTEVVAVILDLGRREELVEQRERALSLGAVRCHVIDAREDFARHYVVPALSAGAFDAAASPMVPAIARPLVAKTLVEIARMEAADAVAFGGPASDLLPLETLIRSLNPSLRAIALSRDAGLSEPALLEHARAHDIPVSHSAHSRGKLTVNLWGRSLILDPAAEPSPELLDEVYVLTRSPEKSPDRPAYVELEFEAGIPSRVNGIEMPLLEMIESLDIIGGTHGIGRSDVVISRADGSACREIDEAPAAALLRLAQRELWTASLDVETRARTDELARTYADLVRTGAWFSPSRAELDALVAIAQPRLSGSVRLMLSKGDCRPLPSLVNS